MDKCSECNYENKTGRDKCPECGGDTWVKMKKKKKKLKMPKPRIPVAPPSRRHKTKKDYVRKKKWVEDDTN